ncbi:MAG: T9SS type A sorting domain-containing protein [Chitinophagaceae bacterium]
MNLKISISIVFIQLMLLSGIKAQGIIIPSGAYVIASNGNIVTKTNWTNNGSFTANGGTVIFNGTTQTINGSAVSSFNNITIVNGSTTTISTAGHQLKAVLLSNGTLNANGNLTVLSTASQTAAIDGTGTGQVLGNVTMQRYLASGFGYKYIASPFASDTVGDLSNDMTLSSSFPLLYRHDENLSSTGWVAYTTGSGVLNPLQGYAANFGSVTGAKTIDLKGVVNNGSYSRTLYNHNLTYTKGFNLVGNPYPSPINWNASSGWTKTNIDNAVYYFNAGTTDQYTGVYSSYVNGVSSDGIAGSTIAAMQGFFVHVTNGTFPVTATLGVNNSVRILSPAATFFRVYGETDKTTVRLRAGFAEETTASDPLAFYFTNDAKSRNFNKELDALKLMNADVQIPSLFAIATDTSKLSINALATLRDTSVTIPLGLITQKQGWISFTASGMQQLPIGAAVWFTDKQTGASYNLQKDSVYRLLLPAGDYENRFFLQFSPKAETNTGVNTPVSQEVKMYSNSGRLYVDAGLSTAERATVTVLNTLGQVSYRQEINNQGYQPLNIVFASGVYIVQVAGNKQTISKKIFIPAR